MNNFNDAHNFEDIMNKPLTEKERKYITDNGALIGCSKLIKDRCIYDIEVPNRPFHCVDSSRNKYILRTNNKWNIDEKGRQILGTTYPIIRPLFDMSVEDIKKKEDNLRQINDLETNGQKKIIGELNTVALLKNNVS